MKRLLLIDAAECPPKDPTHAISEDEEWYRHQFQEIAGVHLECVRASAPELETAAAAADAVILSGSPRDAWSDEPMVLRLVGLLRIAVPRKQPVLGVCFGCQLLARAFGGEVQRNPKGWEVGEVEVTLTPTGRISPLFTGLPPTLRAIESHQDAVLSLPPEATLLASNAHTPVQAFSLGGQNGVINGKPAAAHATAFGVQFHPEMDGEILRDIWKERRERLRGALSFDLDAALQAAHETPDAARIFQNFVSLLP